MSWVDYSIVGVFVASVGLGAWRGVTREVFSLITWVGAFAALWLWREAATQWLLPYIDDPLLRAASGSAAVFMLALLVGAVLTHFLVGWVRGSGFSAVDRTLGGGLGLLRAVVLIALLVLVGERAAATEYGWWQRATLIERFVPLAHSLESLIPSRWLESLEPDQLPTSSPEAG
ncbi:CvpA family protein [Sinimarinibacterium sp. NLF-5-8]|uniref:CvpA family protein n=1 Tax=Sinimarinibacterium sp. NLF-5-8 TaxID=2698684 RepID=UPI00137BED91|nr:CvpA family protein [Sinimarinibacterium sp. NLF-5-8]QHS09724.1 hypothetical protein GT972_05845 [Sinimarinibacterium sp. NLF-5-8]